MDTVKMGKRGSLTIPAKLRKQFGLEDGSPITIDLKDGSIRLRPVLVYDPEQWTPERRAYFLLVNSMTREEWDRNLPEVIALGLDPSRIDGIDPKQRECLLTDAQWEARSRQAKADSEQRLSA